MDAPSGVRKEERAARVGVPPVDYGDGPVTLDANPKR